MFNTIANRYDLLNDILSLGIHRTWLKKAIKYVPAHKARMVLDLATGTGNFAFEFAKANPSAVVIGIDLAEKMLEIAKQKALRYNRNVHFQVGDATHIPFENDTFDIVSISYGIRNVDNLLKCLEEIHRVLKPDGNLLIVEFGTPKPWFKPLYRLYQSVIVKIIGGLISGNFNAYNYLVQTVNSFPSDTEFVKIIENTNLFCSVTYKPLTFGIAYIYTGKAKK